MNDLLRSSIIEAFDLDLDDGNGSNAVGNVIQNTIEDAIDQVDFSEPIEVEAPIEIVGTDATMSDRVSEMVRKGERVATDADGDSSYLERQTEQAEELRDVLEELSEGDPIMRDRDDEGNVISDMTEQAEELRDMEIEMPEFDFESSKEDLQGIIDGVNELDGFGDNFELGLDFSENTASLEDFADIWNNVEEQTQEATDNLEGIGQIFHDMDGDGISQVAANVEALDAADVVLMHDEEALALANHEVTTSTSLAVVPTQTLATEEGVLASETVGLTAAQKISAVATKAWSAVLATSGGIIAKLRVVLDGLKKLIRSTWIEFITSPAAPLIAVGAAIIGIVKGLDALITTTKEASEALKESKDAFDEVTNNVESFSKQLDDINSKIDELNSKESLSISDENELENLRAETTEIQRQIDAEKKLQAEKAKELLKDSDKGFNAGKVLGVGQTAVEYVQTNLKAWGDLYKDGGVLAGLNDRWNENLSGEVFQGKLQNIIQLNEAYKAIVDSGQTLTAEENKQYFITSQILDEYYMQEYLANKTLETYRALTTEQKRSVATDRIMSQDNLSRKQAQAIVNNMDAEQLNLLYSSDFTFDIPKLSDYPSIGSWARAYIQNMQDALNATDNLTESAEKLADATTKLESLDDQLSGISNALKSKSTDGFVNNDTFAGLSEKLSGLDGWDKFVNTLGDASSTMKDCQQAADALATEYVNNSDALSDLTEENAGYYQTALESMGVENAQEVVEAKLAEKREELALSTKVLAETSHNITEATASEISAMIAEGDEADETSIRLAQFALKKMEINNNVISTAADCANLERLIKIAGGTTEQLAKLAALKARLFDANGNMKIVSDTEKENILAAIKRVTNETIDTTVKVKTDVKVNPKGADANKKSSSGKDKSDEYKDEIEAFLKYQEARLENSSITWKEYSDIVQNYLDKMYREGKLKAADYFGYIEDKLNKQKDIYDKVLNAVTRRLDKEIKSWQKKIDALNNRNNQLNKDRDKLDSAVNGVLKIYDDEIDKLQAQLDALNKQNEARSRAIQLEKTQYDLRRAEENRNVKVYEENHGYIYRQDADAVKTAKESLSSAQLEIKTSNLQDQIDALNKAKEAWQSLSETFQRAQDEMNAKALLGQNLQAIVLQNRASDLENFRTRYVQIDTEINNNERLIESYQEKQEFYENLKEQWSEISSAYSNAEEDMLAVQILGDDWEKTILSGRIETLNDFKNAYINLQRQIAQAAEDSAKAQIEAAKAARNSDESYVGGAAGRIGSNSPNQTLNTKPLDIGGSSNAVNKKNAAVARKKQAKVGKGATKFANGGMLPQGEDHVGTIAWRDGERVLTPVQNEMWEKWTAALPSLTQLATPLQTLADVIKTPNYNAISNNSQSQNVEIHIGDIQLTGVNDVDTFAHEITRRLPNQILQQINKR